MTENGSKGPNLQLTRDNLRQVKKLYPLIERRRIRALKQITKQFGLSLVGGELHIINNNWYVTHTGLLRLARRKR